MADKLKLLTISIMSQQVKGNIDCLSKVFCPQFMNRSVFDDLRVLQEKTGKPTLDILVID